MTFLYADLETFSTVPITAGTHRYAEGAEVMLWSYAFDDAAPEVWDLTEGGPMPAALAAGLADPEVMTVWHNGGMFDSVILRAALGIDIPLARMHDTMVQALAHSLPGALGALCDILRIDSANAKDKSGRALIQLFCKEQPFKHSLKRDAFESKAQLLAAIEAARLAWRGRATRKTHPTEWARFIDYARQDIPAMREVHKRLPKWNWNPEELALWRLDQEINRRGMLIDTELVAGALRAIDTTQKALGARARELTDGFLDSAMQRDRLLDFVFAEHGVGFADLRGATLAKFLSREDVDPALRDLMNVRVQASTTSTAKYKTLDKVVSSDGRLRGTKQFCGASRTGRWSGKLFQPDNLPRPTLSAEEVEIGIMALKGDCVDIAFDNPLAVASSALRSVIIAPSGKKLVVADLSNIEGRGLAWLAGEEWLLQAFRDFDAGVGPDIYKLSYAKSFGITPDEVTKAQRQIGKTQTLALGYAGGISAFVTFALAYGIDLDKMAEDAWPALPDEKIREAEDFLEWQATRKDAKVFPIPHRAQVTCEVFKRLWREAHPHIVAWWRELEDAMRTAIDSPGRTIQGVNFKARRDGAWVRLRLPSGRFLCYPQPRIDDNQITYAGTNQFTRKWERVKTYSGKLAENMTQAFARDVMGANMPHIDEAGYRIILTVHDEVITEAPDLPEYNAPHLSRLLAATPPWGAGMPLAAAGFESYRYKKD